MAVPSRIVAIENGTATVEAFGETRRTSLMLLDEEVAVGDWVLLGAGGTFAAEKIPAETAREALETLSRFLADGLA
jgi:hydrogenase assembly chaperone HypC/HupF